jgi:hypothetical protein
MGCWIVFGLDQKAIMSKVDQDERPGAFALLQSVPWGTGLPTKTDCSTRYDPSYYREIEIQGKLQDPGQWHENECWAYSLASFAKEMSEFLAFNLAADIGFVNMIDFICPSWFVNVVFKSRYIHFQRHLNKLYEGVDFKPFLRLQILLKFLFVAMCSNQVDGIGYANTNLLVALCFRQCFEIERFCFVTRYRQPANYTSEIVSTVIKMWLPLALLVHSGFSFFLFGWIWHVPTTLILPDNSTNSSIGKSIEDTEIRASFGEAEISRNLMTWYPLCVFWCFEIFFFVAWFLPLKVWDFASNDTYDRGTDLNRVIATSSSLQESGISTAQLGLLGTHLTYSEALRAQQDMLRGISNPVARVVRINMRRYIPSAARFEFGAFLRIN